MVVVVVGGGEGDTRCRKIQFQRQTKKAQRKLTPELVFKFLSESRVLLAQPFRTTRARVCCALISLACRQHAQKVDLPHRQKVLRAEAKDFYLA